MKEFYDDYFRQKAKQSIIITPNVDQDANIYLLKDKYDLEEFDNAIKNAVNTPAILLEPYFYNASENRARNYFRNISGRFNILDKAETGNQQSITDAQTRCEQYAEEFIAKMREELQEGGTITLTEGGAISPMVFFPFQDIKLDFIGPVSTSYYGVSVGFTWQTRFVATSTPGNWR